MSATEATQDGLAWMQAIPEGEFRCIYCGRYMKDKKATRVARELGHKLRSCMMCHYIVGISRGLSFEGKQRRVLKILKFGEKPIPGHRRFVNREGQEFYGP